MVFSVRTSQNGRIMPSQKLITVLKLRDILENLKALRGFAKFGRDERKGSGIRARSSCSRYALIRPPASSRGYRRTCSAPWPASSRPSSARCPPADCGRRPPAAVRRRSFAGPATDSGSFEIRRAPAVRLLVRKPCNYSRAACVGDASPQFL